VVDKKLHVCYTQKIKSLQTIDFNGFLDKVIVEWE